MEVNFQFLDLQLVELNLELILIKNDPRKKSLQRWYKAVSPLLKVITELVVIKCR
jgi:hypothetical protein